MQTDRLYLRISPDLKRKLETLAKTDRRQVSDYVRLVLEDHINKESTMSIEKIANNILSDTHYLRLNRKAGESTVEIVRGQEQEFAVTFSVNSYDIDGSEEFADLEDALKYCKDRMNVSLSDFVLCDTEIDS